MEWSLRRLLLHEKIRPTESTELPGPGTIRPGNDTEALKTTRFLRNPEVIAQRADRETILFCMSSGRYFSLNEMGTQIWEMSDGNQTASVILAQLEDEYDVAPATLLEDVLSLTNELLGKGLLLDTDHSKTECSGGPPPVT